MAGGLEKKKNEGLTFGTNLHEDYLHATTCDSILLASSLKTMACGYSPGLRLTRSPDSSVPHGHQDGSPRLHHRSATTADCPITTQNC